MKYLFTDDMYIGNESMFYDHDKFRYVFQPVLVDMLESEWRAELEETAKTKFEELSRKDRRWRPYKVIRDSQVQLDPSESSIMKPPICVFRLELGTMSDHNKT